MRRERLAGMALGEKSGPAMEARVRRPTRYNAAMRTLLAGLAALWLVAPIAASAPAWAQESISGKAKVVDGSTLEIEGQTIRFAGIMAPGRSQTCERGGSEWPCGQVAFQRLKELVAGKSVRCSITGRDLDERTIGVCYAGMTELSRAMVSEGLAVSRYSFGIDYLEPQAVAKAARIGLWSGSFVEPWTWRQQHGEAPKPVS